MKTFTVSMLALCALCACALAQSTTAPPPTPSLASEAFPALLPALTPEAALESAVAQILPVKYTAFGLLAVALLAAFGRAVPSLQKGTGLIGWFRALFFGTNTPPGLPAVLLCACMLSLSSCSFLASPEGRQTVLTLTDVGVSLAKMNGVKVGDTVAIHNGVATILDPDLNVKQKGVALAKIGLSELVKTGELAPGDTLKITGSNEAVKTEAPHR